MRRKSDPLYHAWPFLAAMLACSDPTGTDEDAYEVTYDDGAAVYAVRPAGGDPVEIPGTRIEQSIYDVTWSPDARRVAFTQEGCPPLQNCNYRLTLLNLETGQQTSIAGGGGHDATQPMWAPSGERIAYIRNNAELRIVNANATDDRRVGNGLYYVRNPSWSPDGSQIAATARDATNFNLLIVIVDVESGEQVDTVGAGYGPSWSPDGTRIVFTADEVLVVVRLADGHRRVIGEYAYEPAWSPDGQWIAYEKITNRVHVVRPDSTGDHPLSPEGVFTRRPAWRRVPDR